MLAQVALAQAGKLGRQLFESYAPLDIAPHATPAALGEWTATYAIDRSGERPSRAPGCLAQQLTTSLGNVPVLRHPNDVILASSPCLSLHQACSDPMSAKAAGFTDPPSRTLSKVPKLANAYVRALVRMVRTAQNSGSAGPSVQACRSSAALSAGANTGQARRSHRALDAGALALTAAKTFR